MKNYTFEKIIQINLKIVFNKYLLFYFILEKLFAI